LKALVALGWSIEFADYDAANSNRNSMRRSSTVTFVSLSEKVFFIIILLDKSICFQDGGTTPYNYNPNPVDMANLTLSREMQNMAERLAENSHDIWAKKKKEEMASSGNNLFSHTPKNTC
jgi:ryanodine receptor 2